MAGRVEHVPGLTRTRAVARGLGRPVPAAVALALVLHTLWWIFLSPNGGDLAAQLAWSQFVRDHPGSAYDFAWYGGMHPVSYSILSPYLMDLVGVRPTMVVAGAVSAGLLALIVERSRAVTRPWWPAMYGAVCLTGDAISGRVTFAAGTMFGLAAVATVFVWPEGWGTTRGRRGLRAALVLLLAALATATSPVAGLFLGVAAVALWLLGRRPAALGLGVPPALVVAVSALLFPFTGIQPVRWWSVILPIVLSVACVVLVPRGWRTVKAVSAVYLLVVLLAWALPSPVGSNVTRLALLFAGVLLVAAAATRRPHGPDRSVRWRRVLPSALLAVTILVASFWQVAVAGSDVRRTPSGPALDTEVAPLVAQLEERGAGLGRVEVVPTGSHQEAVALAPYFNLARGWNRQADAARNPLFYADRPPTAAQYRRWLGHWAVRFVVLPHVAPDYAARSERRLVRSGVPYLRAVWADRAWTLYRVVRPRALVSGPANVVAFSAAGVTLTTPVAGTFLVRVASSPWLSLVDADGHRLAPEALGGSCLTYGVADGEDATGWVVLHAARPGTFRIAAPYSLPRGTPCR